MQIDDRRPTGTARVELGTDGVPNFILDGEAAWDFAAFTDEAQKMVAEADAICFGSLAQRNEHAASTIRRLVAAAPPDALKIFDVNLRQSYYNRRLIEESLEIANVLKLNGQELGVLAEMFQLAGSESRQLQQLSNRFNLLVVALTRGGSGSMLYQSGTWSDMPGATVDVTDTVGAGDSFSAGLAMGLLHGMSLEQVHRIASEMANFVCSHAGAMPKLPKDLCARFLPDYFNV
jgi:fructokinase